MFIPLRFLVQMIIAVVLVAGSAGLAEAQESAPRYGLALLAGQAYDPDRFGLVILQGNVQLPYDQVFWHGAPDSLFFKGELNFGMTTDGRDRVLAAINMMAVKYVDTLSSPSWRPYLEGGIGVVYTDFRVKGQGLRFNFNPQIGAGIDFKAAHGRNISVGVRLHHLSNADLHRDNRGINSILMLAGVRF
ncbi:MAG: acyloxyacyl hydrolase [Pelovirga sp.]